MKPLFWIVVGLLLVSSWLFLRHQQSRGVAASQRPGNPAPADPKIYLDLRNMMLQGSRAKFGLPPDGSPAEPYGVLMDWGLDNGTATVVAVADGNASVYLSSGGGYLGGGQGHEAIRTAAKKTVALAGDVQSLMKVTTTYPLPQPGQVIFYALSDAGVFTAKTSVADLAKNRSPFSKLGESAQTIITEYRKIQPNN